MTKKQWQEMAKHMKLNYKNRDYLSTDEEVDLWYAMTMNMDFEQAKKAIFDVMTTSTFPPSLADVKARYDEMTKESQESKRIVRELYKEMENYYPACLRDEDRLQAFQDALKSRGNEKAVDRARYIKKRVIQAVKDVERGNEDSLPPLSECIRRCMNERQTT